jgi:hypothetical protein
MEEPRSPCTSAMPFDPAGLAARIPFLTSATITQQAPNTLSATVDRDGPVMVSFFGLPGMARLRPPHIAPDNGLRGASLLDVAGTKAAIVQQRAEVKDYRDLDALFQDGRVDLPAALASAGAIYGPKFNPRSPSRRCLFSATATFPFCRAAREVDLDRLPILTRGPAQ